MWAQKGIQVVAVGLGKPKHALRYCSRLSPSIACYCQESAEIYRLYGLKRGSWLQIAGPKVTLAAARALSRGHVQGKATGDVKMMPGSFLVDREGVIRAVHYNSHIGDHPNIESMLSEIGG